MTRARRLALAAGVFYLLTFAFSIPAFFLYEPVLTDPAYIVGSGGADTRIILGAVLEMLTALAGIGTAVAVYPVVRRQSEQEVGLIARLTPELSRPRARSGTPATSGCRAAFPRLRGSLPRGTRGPQRRACGSGDASAAAAHPSLA